MAPTRMGLLRIRTEIFVDGGWVDISLHVLNRQALAISWGRRDYSSRVTHTKCSPQINNAGGLYSTRNPYSPYFGQLTQNTLVRQSVQLPDGTWEYLQHGEIPSWPKRWDLSGNDSYMPVQTAGILRRLGTGKKALKDPLRRHIDAHGPLAYWPLTDGESAIQGTEVVGGGGAPVRAIGETGAFYQGQPNWSKGTLARWLDPVVELPDETIGRLTAAVSAQKITSWAVDHVFAGGGQGWANTLEIWDNGPRTTADPQVEWSILAGGTPDEVKLLVAQWGDTPLGSLFLITVSDAGISDGAVHHIRLTVADDGAGATTWALHVDGREAGSGTHTAPFHPVQRLTYRWGTIEGGGVPTEAMGLGHLTYWGTDVPAAIDTWRAIQGHVRERAGRRIERLCAEQRVPLQVIGDLDNTPIMGPQKPGKFIELLETAAAVDGGIIHEARDDFALAYRTNRSRYNQGM
ncbi:hypothetical protein [Streptomyces chartreusis]|uniref:hypothetical protein n=1 Tax=Streptomyces chartreusis TaxID=1969 RepID=UPI00382CE396